LDTPNKDNRIGTLWQGKEKRGSRKIFKGTRGRYHGSETKGHIDNERDHKGGETQRK
jgi:hypothetical protein